MTARLVSQRGVFTVHPGPQKPFIQKDMKQIIIEKAAKPDFRRKLDSTGIHDAMINADLDGLSRRLIVLKGYRTPPSSHSESVRSLGYRNLPRSYRPRFFAVHMGDPFESGHHP